MTDYEKVIVKLLVAILNGIVLHHFEYPYSDLSKAYKEYAESTIEMAEELLK